MLTKNKLESGQVRKRAAAVRGNWTAGERRRRMGLPPDIPIQLRDYLLAPRLAVWHTPARS